MEDAAPTIPGKSLQCLKKLASQMGADSGPDKVKKIGCLAEQFVLVFNQCKEDLERREEAVRAIEANLEREKASIEAAKPSLKSQEALAKLSGDVGEINARDEKFMSSLLSRNEKALEEIGKTGTKVTESERRLTDKMQANHQACVDAISSRDGKISIGVAAGVAAGVKISLDFGMRCINQGTVALTKCENSLALRLDDTMGAVSSSEGAVRDAVSSCEGTLLADGSQTREEVSSSGKALENKLTSLSCELEGQKREMARLASSGVQDVMGQVRSSGAEVKGLVRGMGETIAALLDDQSALFQEQNNQALAGLQAHIDSVLDTKSKGSITEVKTALDQGIAKLSVELGRCQTELANLLGQDRLKSVFAEISRDDEVLERLREVQTVIPQPDTSVAEAVSELKQMLQDTSRREGELGKQLADANKKIESVSADLEKSQGERDQVQAELDQLKAKLPQTPRRSDHDSGSDEPSFDVSSEEEQEMTNLVNSVDRDVVVSGPGAPTVTDLQDRIRDLEEELRQSELSRAKSAEKMVCKTDLDDAMDKMFKKLSVRDDQAARIAELEKDLQASVRRASDAEQKVAALEAAAQDGSGNRGRKRSRLQQDESSSSEAADKSTFKSVSSAICKAMDEIRMEQPERPDLPVAEIIVNMTRALASAERKQRLMQFIKGDQTGRSFCLGSVALSDEPSTDECQCIQLQGSPASQCMSFRVLDNSTTEVEFSLVDFEP
ncbi:hypothetical protein LA080_016017 [Diaporthe eres]|uniref:Uncharacterized protein n=1 Tax=Diaporthe vaccinii TaxID=105482 RepID=A0ABR4E062_9PEZI|nr:hypothetical protein LA080_016017 [Diaporthe eres]